MSGILNKVLEIAKKLGYFALEYAYVAMYWTLRLLKIQGRKWKRCSVRKNLDRAYNSLGAEIYFLHKQGEPSDWRNMLSVQQQLKQVEEAESYIFQVDESIEEINNEYLTKKQELKEKYSSKREGVTAPAPRDEDQSSSD